jgi:hypothetical protein
MTVGDKVVCTCGSEVCVRYFVITEVHLNYYVVIGVDEKEDCFLKMYDRLVPESVYNSKLFRALR